MGGFVPQRVNQNPAVRGFSPNRALWPDAILYLSLHSGRRVAGLAGKFLDGQVADWHGCMALERWIPRSAIQDAAFVVNPRRLRLQSLS